MNALSSPQSLSFGRSPLFTYFFCLPFVPYHMSNKGIVQHSKTFELHLQHTQDTK